MYICEANKQPPVRVWEANWKLPAERFCNRQHHMLQWGREGTSASFRSDCSQNWKLSKITDCHTSGASRSESKITMIAGGNHTTILCGLVRNDSSFRCTLHHFWRSQLPHFHVIARRPERPTWQSASLQTVICSIYARSKSHKAAETKG